MSLRLEHWMQYPKIDAHCHAGGENPGDRLVAIADDLGVVEMWCSQPISAGRIAPMEEVRARNDKTLEAMKRHPDRIQGMCFVIPGYYGEALAEVERCLDAGMIGVKLYNQYLISDPVVGPILELVSERKVPLLEHAGYLTTPDLERQPLISHGEHFKKAGDRYPDAIMIHAHIGGGGDWERTVRAMRYASPNVYCDTSGSNLDDGQVEMAVAEMGVERVLYGSDGTMAGGVGKVIDATITDEEKEMLFWGNCERILGAQGRKTLRVKGEI
jgi:predicted TIM-barrel fold metal-dependent hydrolase